MNQETLNVKQRGKDVGKKHAMSTYMEKLCKTVYKDLSRITSHFTYGYCDSIEDDNCDHDLPEKYPLLGYTDFDDSPDRFLLCKSYFIMCPNQVLKLYISLRQMYTRTLLQYQL